MALDSVHILWNFNKKISFFVSKVKKKEGFVEKDFLCFHKGPPVYVQACVNTERSSERNLFMME